MLLLANGLLNNEVLRWKAIGAAAWLAAVVVCANAFWSVALAPGLLLAPLRLLAGLFSPSTWVAAAAVVVAQAPAFAAQAALLTTKEPRPVPSHRLALVPGLSALAVSLGKLAARAGSVTGAIRVAAFLALHALSAALSLSLFTASRGVAWPGASWTLLYGLWLSAAFLLHWAYWGLDVALFPTVQRHRYFRIRQRAPAAAAHAAKLTALAATAAGVTALARAHAACTPAALPGSPAAAAAALLAGSFCTLCWLMAGAVLEVVFTERVRPDGYSDRDVLAAMAASLAGKKGELMRGLALQDASLLAADVGKAALRRADMFADETGDRWRPVAAACISELDAVATAVAAAAVQQKPAALAGGAGAGAASAGASVASQHRKWNALPSGLSSKGGPGSSQLQLEALGTLRRGCPHAALAAQALAGFACASLVEDRFGVLQLTQPSLGDVLLCLLGALGAAQQAMRSAASLAPRQLSLGPWRGNGDYPAGSGSHSAQPVDAAASALADVLTVCLYRITATFGDGLVKVLADCKSKPAFGSAADAAALLQQFLKGQA